MDFREIISKLLECDISEEDLDKPLEDMGIDSIKLWRIIAELEEQFDVEFEISEVVEAAQNLRNISNLLKKKVAKKHGRNSEGNQKSPR